MGDFNARIHKIFDEEADSRCLGPYVFGQTSAHIDAQSNRSLLLELCHAHDLAVANTFMEQPACRQVTVYNVGSSPVDELTAAHFGQIDFVLVQRAWLGTVRQLYSDMNMALASHHFAVIADLQIAVPKVVKEVIPKHASNPRVCVSALTAVEVANRFALLFDESMSNHEDHELSIDDFYHVMSDAFQHAAEKCLPQRARTAKRPWISSETLSLLQRRDDARFSRDVSAERDLSKQIRRSVAEDRRAWLDQLLQSGDWSEIRKLRKGFAPKCGRLRDVDGEVVESELHAESLAKYFQDVQWAVRPVSIATTDSPIGSPLPVEMGPFNDEEIVAAASRLRRNKATGNDHVPAEFWKAICRRSSPACRWATTLCNAIREHVMVPSSWHDASVTAIFKKGDPGLCKNYRPITVVSAGYKLFAMALLRRLQKAGAEERIWPTQFAFRTKRGSADAIFVARRLLDLTLADRNGTLVMLSLDWEKAFDSISPDGMLYALERFGLPPLFRGLIRAIYSNRTFTVRASGHSSASHTQCFGISQGCPLSPFLFSILMTVLFTDATREFQSVSGLDSPSALVNDLIYADDTLILSLQPRQAESFMYRVLDAGRVYGLSLNWEKTEVLPIGCDAAIQGPNGEHIKNKTSLVYLGSVISASGSITSEVNRRLGMAKADFDALNRVWKHAHLTCTKKLQIFSACVVSRLMYSLHTAWLCKADLRKIDAFQARCLRSILGIPHSFISRVRNETVLQEAGTEKLSIILWRRQLLLLGRIAQLPREDVMRTCIFHDGTFQPRWHDGLRKRGRPKQTWLSEVFRMALNMCGDRLSLETVWNQTPTVWRHKVLTHNFTPMPHQRNG